MLTIGKRSLSITVFQGNLGSSIRRRASGTRGLAVGKINHCGNGCGRTVHRSISLQKSHPHPHFARIGLVARIGLCAVGIGLATAGFAAARSPLAQDAKTSQQGRSPLLAVENPAIQRSPAFLRYRDLKTWYGLPVHAVVFTGVLDQDLVGVKDRLPLQPGKKLTEQNVKESLHALFATGLYRSIVAEGVETGGQITVTFDGVPQLFLRRLYIQGMKQDTLAAQIQRATRLELGESFTAQELDQATEHLRQRAGAERLPRSYCRR